MARPVLKTPICELLGIEYPILLAGMGGGDGFARAELAAAVSEAGGLGIIGAAGWTPDQIHEECEKVRSLTKKPFGIDILLPAGAENPPAGPQDIDPSYNAWAEGAIERLGLTAPPPPPASTPDGLTPRQRQDRQVEAIIKEKPVLMAAGLGSPEPYVKSLHDAGIVVLGLVGNVKTAKRVKDGGADIVVAQGHEAGGHTGRVGTFALTPQVVDAIAPTPVVVAGGVGDGRGIAAALALGAQGVWIGTAFLATNEAHVLPVHKQHFVEMSEEDTRITRLFSGKTLRHPYTTLTDDWERSGLKALPMGVQGTVSNRVQAAARHSGRDDLLYQPAGQIVGMVKQIRPAADVLDEMVRGAIEVIEGLQRQKITISVST
jgi:NAD(P)H-dependent flavin oxidoreductase YrpB (nitropropane dioxygenase family)